MEDLKDVIFLYGVISPLKVPFFENLGKFKINGFSG